MLSRTFTLKMLRVRLFLFVDGELSLCREVLKGQVFAGLEDWAKSSQARFREAKDGSDHGPIIGRRLDERKKTDLQPVEVSSGSILRSHSCSMPRRIPDSLHGIPAVCRPIALDLPPLIGEDQMGQRISGRGPDLASRSHRLTDSDAWDKKHDLPP